jgi:ParB-like chromosome segregation protein Spo0J
MPANFSNTTTKTTGALQSDLPKNIILDPVLNGRYERNTPEVKATVEALAASIKANGQNTPAKVRKTADGKPLLVFGYCRYHAVELINAEERKNGVPEKSQTRLEFDYEKLTETESLIQAIQENHIRVGVTAMDHCYNIQNLRKLKVSDEDIALVYFPNFKRGEKKDAALKFVKEHGALAELVPEAVEAVNKGEVKVTTAVKLAKVSPDKQKEIIAKEMEVVKGKKRLKVAAVIAATGKGKTAEKAKAQVQAQKDKKQGIKPAASAPKPVAPAPVPAPKASPFAAAAERLACAVDMWRGDATASAERALIAAHDAYRALQPLKKTEEALKAEAAA